MGSVAELITTRNMGSRTPCTVRRLGQDQVPGIPENRETEQEKVASGCAAETGRLADDLAVKFNEIEGLLQKKTLSKADREKIRQTMNHTLTEVLLNMHFVLKQFVESSENVATATKAEVEGFLNSALHKAGLEGLKAKLLGAVVGGPALPSGDDSE